MIEQTKIYITRTDRERLEALIEFVRDSDDRAHFAYVKRLEKELEDAEIIASEEIPPNVVTMRSKVKFKDLDTGEENIFSIVFPNEANFEEGKVSILAPLATALLGYKCGDTVSVEAVTRRRRLKIEEILYQPESAGDLNL